MYNFQLCKNEHKANDIKIQQKISLTLLKCILSCKCTFNEKGKFCCEAGAVLRFPLSRGKKSETVDVGTEKCFLLIFNPTERR